MTTSAEAGSQSSPEPLPLPRETQLSRFALYRWYPSLADPDLRRIWLSLIPSTLSFNMSTVASGYAALTISGSATAMGLTSAASGVPMFLLLVIGGIMADRFSRKTILFITQAALGLASAVIAALSFAGVLEVWHLIALGLVQGTVFAFGMPTRQSYMAELAGPKLLGNAMALFNVGINLCRIIGPALAGALLSVPGIGIASVFAFMTLSYLTAFPLIAGLPTHRRGIAPSPSPSTGNGWDQLLEGLGYIAHSRNLLGLIGLAFVTAIIGLPFQMLMPVFAEREFQVGAAGLGMLMAALGFGALVGSIAVGPFATSPRVGMLQNATGIAFGASLIMFALSPNVMGALVLLFIAGAVSAAFIALNSALIMANTERRLYGRVTSVYGMTFAIMPVAALPMAWLTDQIGARLTVASAGMLVSLAVLAVMGLRASTAPPNTISVIGR